MAYSDILRSIDTFGTNYRDYARYQYGTNPYSSAAYTPRDVRAYQQTLQTPVDPRSAYSDYEYGWGDRGLKGLSYMGIGRKLNIPGQSIDKLMTGTSKLGATLKGGDAVGTTFEGAGDFNLGSAALVAGLTRDGNPYEQSGLEHAGNIATGAIIGKKLGTAAGMNLARAAGTKAALGTGTGSLSWASAAGPLGMFAGLLGGALYSTWKQKKIDKENKKIIDKLTEDRKEYDDKLEAYNQETRDQAISAQKAQLWSQQTQKYDNQYGAYTNPYGTSYYDEGGVVPMQSTAESMPMDSLLNRQLFKESRLDVDAESDAGALGLSQIMPGTFKYFQEKGWVPEGKKFNDLKTDPELATSLQERYMTDLLDRDWNTGSEEVRRAKALAAYNMGPTKFVKKLNKLKKEGVDIYNSTGWVNELNSETSDYVNKILLGNNPKFEKEYSEGYAKDKESKKTPSAKAMMKMLKFSGGKTIDDLSKEQRKKIEKDFNEMSPSERKKWVDTFKTNPEKTKIYANGGLVNAIAEFTGNELIVNNQNQVEMGLAEKDYTKAAAPIREAIDKGYITPGEETHQGNPMPVDEEGNIYTGGGKLPFKAARGAGIYDHATDQFKKDMSDKEIAMVAKKNISKWKSNGMA